MTFGAYEIFSILSGIAILLGAFIPDLSPRHRLGAVIAGGFFFVYGFYVAAQTTGTWEFPAIIFVIPFVAVGLGIWKLATHNSTSTSTFPTNATFPSTRVDTPAPPLRVDRDHRACASVDCTERGVATSDLVCRVCRSDTAPGPSWTPPPAAAIAPTAAAKASIIARETRWCAGSGCQNHQVRTSNLVCQGCRQETEMAY